MVAQGPPTTETETPLRPPTWRIIFQPLLQKGMAISLIFLVILKGHGSEPVFPMFLQKPVRHGSLTLLFEPFRFWLQILGEIRNRKTTPRIGESGSRQDCLELPFFKPLD